MKSEVGEVRNTATSARSSGRSQRPVEIAAAAE
jgi:hypothetical protein